MDRVLWLWAELSRYSGKFRSYNVQLVDIVDVPSYDDVVPRPLGTTPPLFCEVQHPIHKSSFPPGTRSEHWNSMELRQIRRVWGFCDMVG
jgi:hypothetical protein